MATNVIIMGACGRMGKMLVDLAQADENYKLIGVVDKPERLAQGGFSGDVAQGSLEEVLAVQSGAVIIDFTAPEASIGHATLAAAHGASMVIGTTGFTEAQKEVLQGLAVKTPLFWAPNMSVGVNVLLKVLPELVRLLGESYDMEMVELHHNRKKDSPSGTALRLGECLAEARGWQLGEVMNAHREGIIGERPHKEIGIQTVRGGDVVGVHTMYFMGPGERIEVTHQAHSRETFAQGALRAARWLSGQKAERLYSMPDIF